MKRDSTAPDLLDEWLERLELEAIVAAAVRDLQASEYTWRRLLLLEPNRRAKALPRREFAIAAQVPTEMRTKGDVVAIASESSPNAVDTRGGAHVHPSPREQYKPTTPERATTLKLLRSIDEPLTKVRVARALCWTEDRAREWLAFFASKGVLVVRGGRHYWATRAGSR